jgi:hypothetical protein
MHNLTPGAWYLLFLCKGCKTRQVLFPDLTQGKSKLVATYVIACQKCQHKASYDGDRIQRYRHPDTARRAVA